MIDFLLTWMFFIELLQPLKINKAIVLNNNINRGFLSFLSSEKQFNSMRYLC